LKSISDRLRDEGFHPLLYVARKLSNQRFRKNQNHQTPEDRKTGLLRLLRKHEVLNLAEKLLRISRHGEKISKMRLIMRISLMANNEIVARLDRLRRKIRREVRSFEERAEREYKKGKLATFGQGVVG